MSARSFSRAIGVPDNNTQNYLGATPALPKADYLEKVLLHFKSINPMWLLTGQGEPFTGDAPTTSIDINAKKNKGNVQSSNSGDNTINHNHITLEDCKRDLEASRKEAEMLREQIKTKDALLDSKDALIAAKEEMLTLLRGGYNRPN